MKLKAHKHNRPEVFILEENDLKDWIDSRPYVAVHAVEVSDNKNQISEGEFITIGEVKDLIDKSRMMGVYTANVYNNHRLCILTNEKLYALHVGYIDHNDIQTY